MVASTKIVPLDNLIKDRRVRTVRYGGHTWRVIKASGPHGVVVRYETDSSAGMIVVYPRSSNQRDSSKSVWVAERRQAGRVESFGSRFRDYSTAMEAAERGVTVKDRQARTAAREARQRRVCLAGPTLLSALKAAVNNAHKPPRWLGKAEAAIHQAEDGS